MTKFYETDEFKALNAKWKKKLENAGFDEIEQEDGKLKSWASLQFMGHFDHTAARAKEDYYRMAGHFLHEYEFKSRKERLIWEGHCQGKSARVIALELKKKRFFLRDHKVQSMIVELAEIMKEKYQNDKTDE